MDTYTNIQKKCGSHCDIIISHLKSVKNVRYGLKEITKHLEAGKIIEQKLRYKNVDFGMYTKLCKRCDSHCDIMILNQKSVENDKYG